MISSREGNKQKSISEMDLIARIRKGIGPKDLAKLAKRLELSIPDISELLPVSARTIQRYDSKKNLSKTLSEHVISLQCLLDETVKVFENKQKAVKWLKRPCMALNNEKPLDLCDTYQGMTIVSQELIRIDHGVFA